MAYYIDIEKISIDHYRQNGVNETVADPIELHQRINQRIKEHTFFNGGIGINDVKIIVETAKELPLDVEY